MTSHELLVTYAVHIAATPRLYAEKQLSSFEKKQDDAIGIEMAQEAVRNGLLDDEEVRNNGFGKVILTETAGSAGWMTENDQMGAAFMRELNALKEARNKQATS